MHTQLSYTDVKQLMDCSLGSVAVQYGVLKWASHNKKIILDKPKKGSRHKRVGLDKATDHLITL